MTDSGRITTEYTGKEKIEKMIAITNDKNSHQTEDGSHTLSPVFTNQLESHGEEPSTPHVLNGRYTIPYGTNRSIAGFLSACQQHNNISEVQEKVDIFHQYRKTKQILNIRKKGTCTYNQHMGHYQAAIRDYNLN